MRPRTPRQCIRCGEPGKLGSPINNDDVCHWCWSALPPREARRMRERRQALQALRRQREAA
jgi:hypothetical protein